MAVSGRWADAKPETALMLLHSASRLAKVTV